VPGLSTSSFATSALDGQETLPSKSGGWRATSPLWSIHPGRPSERVLSALNDVIVGVRSDYSHISTARIDPMHLVLCRKVITWNQEFCRVAAAGRAIVSRGYLAPPSASRHMEMRGRSMNALTWG